MRKSGGPMHTGSAANDGLPSYRSFDLKKGGGEPFRQLMIFLEPGGSTTARQLPETLLGLSSVVCSAKDTNAVHGTSEQPKRAPPSHAVTSLIRQISTFQSL